MPRMHDAAAESDSNATLFDNCCKALQKALECTRCKPATYLFQGLPVSQTLRPHRKRGGLGIKTYNLLTLLLVALLDILVELELIISRMRCTTHITASAAYGGRRVWRWNGDPKVARASLPSVGGDMLQKSRRKSGPGVCAGVAAVRVRPAEPSPALHHHAPCANHGALQRSAQCSITPAYPRLLSVRRHYRLRTEAASAPSRAAASTLELRPPGTR